MLFFQKQRNLELGGAKSSELYVLSKHFYISYIISSVDPTCFGNPYTILCLNVLDKKTKICVRKHHQVTFVVSFSQLNK